MEKLHFTPSNVKKIFTTPSSELANVSPKVSEYVHGIDNSFSTMAQGAFTLWGESAAQPIIEGYLNGYTLAQKAAIYGTVGNA